MKSYIAIPGTVSQLTDGDTDWENLSNVQAEDGSYANVPAAGSTYGARNTILATNFTWPGGIPGTENILGIIIWIKGYGTESNHEISDVQLRRAGANYGTGKADTGITLPQDVSGYISVGSNSDTWSATLSASIVSESGFGFRLVLDDPSTTGADKTYIDVLKMEIITDGVDSVTITPDSVQDGDSVGSPYLYDASDWRTALQLPGLVGRPNTYLGVPSYISVDPVQTDAEYGSLTLTTSYVITPGSVQTGALHGTSTIYTDEFYTDYNILATSWAPRDYSLPAGAQIISPDPVQTDAEYGDHTLTTGAVSILPDGLDAGGISTDLVIVPGAVSIVLSAGVDAGDISSDLVISVGSVTISVDGLDAGSLSTDHTIVPGSVTIVLSAGVDAGNLSSDNTITVGAAFIIVDGLDAGTLSTDHAITTGPVYIAPDGLDAFGISTDLIVSAGVTFITLSAGIDESVVSSDPLLLSGAILVSVDGIDAGSLSTDHILLPGSVTILPDSLDEWQVPSDLTVVPGAVSILPTDIDAGAFGADPTIYAYYVISPTTLGDQQQFDTAILNLTIMDVGGIDQAVVSTDLSILTEAIYLYPDGIDAAGISDPIILVGAVSILPDPIDESSVEEPTITVGPVIISPPSIDQFVMGSDLELINATAGIIFPEAIDQFVVSSPLVYRVGGSVQDVFPDGTDAGYVGNLPSATSLAYVYSRVCSYPDYAVSINPDAGAYGEIYHEPWINPANAKISDDSTTYVDNDTINYFVPSEYLVVGDFGFDALGIPEHAVLKSVIVTIERHREIEYIEEEDPLPTTSVALVDTSDLAVLSSVLTNQALWALSDELVTFGNNFPTPGWSAGISMSEAQAAEFGARISIDLCWNQSQYHIDSVKMCLIYIEPIVVLPDTVGDGSAVGEPTIVPGAVSIAPASIDDSGVGSPSVARTIAPYSIYQSIVSNPLVRGRNYVLPDSLADISAVGDPVVLGEQTIFPGSINDGVVATPTILRGSVTIVVDTLGEVSNVSDLAFVAASINPAGITYDGGIGAPTVVVGAAYIYPEGLDGGWVSSPNIYQKITGVGGLDQAVVSDPTQVFLGNIINPDPGDTPDPLLDFYVNIGNELGTPTLVVLPVTIQPASIDGFGISDDLNLGLSIQVPSLGDNAIISTHQVLPGTYTIYPDPVQDDAEYGNFSVIHMIIIAEGVPSQDAYGSPMLVHIINQNDSIVGWTGNEQVLVPTIAVGISPSSLGDTSSTSNPQLNLTIHAFSIYTYNVEEPWVYLYDDIASHIYPSSIDAGIVSTPSVIRINPGPASQSILPDSIDDSVVATDLSFYQAKFLYPESISTNNFVGQNMFVYVPISAGGIDASDIGTGHVLLVGSVKIKPTAVDQSVVPSPVVVSTYAISLATGLDEAQVGTPGIAQVISPPSLGDLATVSDDLIMLHGQLVIRPYSVLDPMCGCSSDCGWVNSVIIV